MPRDKRNKQQIRSSIAAAAARIMAEDGLDDFALAKRKAARQLGVQSAQALPDNTEIEEALHQYLELYQADEQPERVRLLREEALRAMQMLADFRPYLRGPVLKGTAGRFSGIDLQLFADDSKSVEIFLLNRKLPFEVLEARHQGGRERGVPVFRLDWEGIELNLAVHPLNDERVTAHPTGRPMERASISTLRNMLEQPEQDSPDRSAVSTK